MANKLMEGAAMLTSSLSYGGAMTYDQIIELDWLKNISYYGISLYIREAERNGWIKVLFPVNKPPLYKATDKGRKMTER